MSTAPLSTQSIGAGWRALFWAAAAFNFVIGALGMFSPEATSDARIIGLLILCFGILYALIARDPVRFAPTLWAGVIGKLGVVGLLGPQAFAPGGETLIAVILSLDAAFALAFLAFLLTQGDAKD